MLNEIVFEGSSNPIKLKVSEDDIPINFVAGGVIRMELYVGSITVTSDTSRLKFFDGGEIEICLGDVEGISCKRSYAISLKIFTVSDSLGKLIIHPKMDQSSLKIEVVSSRY